MIESAKIQHLIYAIFCKYKEVLQICRISLLEIPELKQNILFIGESHFPPPGIYRDEQRLRDQAGVNTYSSVQEMLIYIIRLLATQQTINLFSEEILPTDIKKGLLRSTFKELASYETPSNITAMRYFIENKHPNVNFHSWDIRDTMVNDITNIMADQVESFKSIFTLKRGADPGDRAAVVRHNRMFFIKALNSIFGLYDRDTQEFLDLEMLLEEIFIKVMKKQDANEEKQIYIEKVFESIFIKRKSDYYFRDILNNYLRIKNKEHQKFIQHSAFPILFDQFLNYASSIFFTSRYWSDFDNLFLNPSDSITYDIIIALTPISDLYSYTKLLTQVGRNKTSVYVGGNAHTSNMMELFSLQFGVEPVNFFSSTVDCHIKDKQIQRICKSINKNYKQCKPNEIYNIETMKCMNVDNIWVDQIKKPLKDRIHPCENLNCDLGKICDPLTGRCVRDIYASPPAPASTRRPPPLPPRPPPAPAPASASARRRPAPASARRRPERKSRKKIKDCSEKKCPKNKVCNPRSIRCITKNGRLYNQNFKCENKKCPINKICNPKTNRCITINGPVYKKLYNPGP